MSRYDCDNPRVAYRNSFEQIDRGYEQIKRRYAEDIEHYKKTGRWPDWLLREIEEAS